MGNGDTGMNEESGMLGIKRADGREGTRDSDTVRGSGEEEKLKHDGEEEIQADVMLPGIKPGPGAAIHKGLFRSSVFTLKISFGHEGYCSGRTSCLHM